MRLNLHLFWERIRLGVPTNRMQELLERPCREYEVWLRQLPTEPIKGLREACWKWIRYWGNGGGDCSTEMCVQAALDAIETEKPDEVATAMFDNISGYSKTPFEASVLVMDIINECVQEKGMDYGTKTEHMSY